TPIATGWASQVWSDYGENAVKADSFYKGKYVQLKGEVRCVQTDANGRYYVGFVAPVDFGGVSKARYNRMTPQEKKWFNEGFPPNVICYLAIDSQTDFAQVRSEEHTSELQSRFDLV